MIGEFVQTHPGGLVVIKGGDFENDAIREGVAEIARTTGCLVVILPSGSTLEALDEDEMRRHGWIRLQQVN